MSHGADIHTKSTQNGYIECSNRTYCDAALNMYLFNTLNEVRELTETGSKNITMSCHMTH
nr:MULTISPECIES: transposase [unclassified Vibrio]